MNNEDNSHSNDTVISCADNPEEKVKVQDDEDSKVKNREVLEENLGDEISEKNSNKDENIKEESNTDQQKSDACASSSNPQTKNIPFGAYHDGQYIQGPNVDVNELPPKLLKSPYMRDPFAFAEYHSKKNTAQKGSYPQMTSSRPKIFVPTGKGNNNHGIKKYRIEPVVPPIEYPKRTQLISQEETKYKEGLQEKYKKQYSRTPYEVDIISIRDRSIQTSSDKMREYHEVDKKQRVIVNRESKEAINESKRHDLYHNDEYFSPHDPSLRIVPVSDRIQYKSPRRYFR